MLKILPLLSLLCSNTHGFYLPGFIFFFIFSSLSFPPSFLLFSNFALQLAYFFFFTSFSLLCSALFSLIIESFFFLYAKSIFWYRLPISWSIRSEIPRGHNPMNRSTERMIPAGRISPGHKSVILFCFSCSLSSSVLWPKKILATALSPKIAEMSFKQTLFLSLFSWFFSCSSVFRSF